MSKFIKKLAPHMHNQIRIQETKSIMLNEMTKHFHKEGTGINLPISTVRRSRRNFEDKNFVFHKQYCFIIFHVFCF